MVDVFEGTRGFIFDCDGTLLDTMRVWNDCEDELQRLAGRRFTQAEFEEVRSASITEAAAIFHNRFGIGESPEDVLDFMDGMLLDFYRHKVSPEPGVPELLTRAHEAGIPCTVVTSSPRRFVEAGLRRCGLFDFFVKVCTTDELNMSKSEPGIYRHALAAMDSRPEMTWGFDDAVYAIRVMRSLGIRTIGAYDCDETGSFEALAAEATHATRDLGSLL